MRTYSYNVNGAQYDVTIESIQGQMAKVNVNGVAFDVEMLGALHTHQGVYLGLCFASSKRRERFKEFKGSRGHYPSHPW